VLQYLEMVRYHYQERLIRDQVNRAQTRYKNISTFYANGKVTKSDLLRAEVQLANAQLSATANRNDNLISNQRLNTLLNIDENTQIVPVDTASLPLKDSLTLDALLRDQSGNYALQKAQKQLELQENRTRLARSFNHPTISLFGGYGFNYPNNFMFPPVAQTIGVGTLGVKVSYDISSLYQNKDRVKAAHLRETALIGQKRWLADNVQQEAQALVIKYHEAVHRLQVIRRSIEQAETNLHIQTTKYANQLSLLTDLLEADNLYQETRFNYLQANIAAYSIYYRLLFITGNL
jgi:outer membrane protein TolC